ncbi:F-box/FBD/LRR-repeat protein at3g26920, partial [Phtheirospermum japonicum]
ILDLAAVGSLVKFDKLIELHLAANCSFLVKFLESAENLQDLIIREVHKKHKNWMEPVRQVPKCLSSHLRTIIIDEFGSTEQEFEMIKYLLRNSKVLETMDIYSIDAINRIVSYQRGSKACDLTFH